MALKKVYLVLAVVFMVCGLSFHAAAAGGSVKISVDGKNHSITNQIIDKEGTVFIELGALCSVLDASYRYKDGTYTIFSRSNIIEIYENKKEFIYNSLQMKLDKNTIVKDNSMYVPVSLIEAALKFDASQDGGSLRIDRKMPKRVGLQNAVKGIMVNNYTVAPVDAENTLLYERLAVPAASLAEVLKGSYMYDGSSKKAVLKLDGSVFEFTVNSDIVLVNGKEQTLPGKAVLSEGNLMVSTDILVNNLKSYDAISYDGRAMVIRLKGKVDLYDDNGSPIGLTTPAKYKNHAEALAGIIKDKNEAERIDKLSDDIVKKLAKPGMSDFEKVVAVNRYIVENTSYDFTFKSEGEYDALTKGTAICQGYAYSTGLLLEKMGVENIVVFGFVGVDGRHEADRYELLNYKGNLHAWNMVYLDGQYYHLDTTWNDDISNKNYYKYFLLMDDEISEDHVWRRAFYPAADKIMPDKGLEQIRSSGAIGAKVKVKLNGSLKADGDMAYIKASPGFSGYGSRVGVIGLSNKKKSAEIAITAGKEVDSKRMSFTAEGVVNVAGFFQEANFYDIEVSGSYPLWVVTVTPKELRKITGKVIFPDDVKIETSQEFYIRLDIYKKISTGFSLNSNEQRLGIAKIVPGRQEFPFEIIWAPPQHEDFYYEISFSSSDTYEGETLVVTPYLPSGGLDADGNVTASQQKIRAIDRPLKEIIIRVPENPNYKTGGDPKEQGVKINSAVLKELTESLKKHNFINSGVLSGIKTLKDAEKLEGAKPIETEDNSIYYRSSLACGISLYRTYYYDPSSKSMTATVNINNASITKNDFLKVFGELNKSMKEGLKAEALAEVRLNVPELGLKSVSGYKEDEIFKMLLEDSARLQFDYKQGKLKYRAIMRGEEETIKIQIRCTISL